MPPPLLQGPYETYGDRRDVMMVDPSGGGRTRTVRDPRSPEDPESEVAAAVIETLRYSNIFRWPLKPDEIHRFLPVAAGADAVATALRTVCRSGLVSSTGGFHVLPGEENLIGDRERRATTSTRLWSDALRWGHVVSVLPWVRLVAVSGSLAVGAADDDADIDLFIVAADGRLWLARALTIAVVRLAAMLAPPHGVRLCPNYLVAASALRLAERDPFTAHEIAQLVPLFGSDAYRALLTGNAWYRQFLPNHPGHAGPVPDTDSRISRLIERVLSNRLGDRVERWEMRRKVARLSAGATGEEVRFDRTMCKGHFGGHRRRVLTALGPTLNRPDGGEP